MPQYHFISGLPRSGSTLLAGILRQNRDFHAAMSSPVASLMNSCLEQIGVHGEFASFFCNNKRKDLCCSLFDSFYRDKADIKYIFDTNRIWTAKLHQLIELFPHFKMICCVRDPAWVMDSFEVIYRKNPFEYSRMFSPQSRQTVYSRCDALTGGNGVFGSALSSLKEAYYGEFSDKLLLVDYDLLSQHPKRTMELLYQFLDIPAYQHDFDNIEYDEGEFDKAMGVTGLHSVRRKVTFEPRRSVLPPDLFKQYQDLAFWQDSTGSNASIITASCN